MKKYILSIFLIHLFLLSFVFAQDKIAVMIKSKGSVTIQQVKTGKKIAAKVGTVLMDGDKVITGKRGFAAVRFLDDKSLIRIREKSVCTIEGKKQEDKIEKSIWVEIGSFFASVFKPKGSFKVITPTSVASIKGTKFWTIHQLNSGTMYIGIEGVVEVSNEKGKALMKAGETTIVPSKDDAPLVRETKDSDFPEGAEDTMGQTLELEFEKADGSKKQLKIELQKKE
ncbi:MAG: hypothetical protein Kow00108_09960 [Calditrichia bacterium]